MLFLILAAKLVCEIAWLCLVGRGVLAVLAGPARHQNLIYGLLTMATRPFVAMVRPITPKLVLPRHHPLVAFALLSAAWLALAVAKVFWCLPIGAALCR